MAAPCSTLAMRAEPVTGMELTYQNGDVVYFPLPSM